MHLNTILDLAASLLCLGLASFVLFQDRRSLVHRLFAIGMVAFAGEAVLMAMSAQAASASDVLFWQRLRFVAAAIIPGIWLLFSLSFARANPEGWVTNWKWVIVAAFALPLVLVYRFIEIYLITRTELQISSNDALLVLR
jgi:histidine kinase-like protein